MEKSEKEYYVRMIHFDITHNHTFLLKHFNFIVQTWAPQFEIANFILINEKSTFFDQTCSNLQGMTYPGCYYFLKV